MAQALVRAKLARIKVAKLKREAAAQAMKSLFAKEKFRAARSAGLQDVMEEAAACMLQAAWRARLARRHAEELRRQHREQQAALRVVGAFRIARARRIARQLRRERASATKIQALVRGKSARRQLEMDLRSEVRPIIVEIVQCRNIGCVLVAPLPPTREEGSFCSA